MSDIGVALGLEFFSKKLNSHFEICKLLIFILRLREVVGGQFAAVQSFQLFIHLLGCP